MLSTSSRKIEKEFKNLRKNLLDLTLRNQLLNFKSRAKTITVVNQSPLNIYQTLVLQNKKMYFVANKKEKKEDSKFSIWDHSPIDLSRFTEGDKTLQTNLTPNELQKRSFYINQQAKTMLQEQGYNVLYLAVGFLEWNDNSKPKQKNLAPLILVPVSIERKKVGKSFELSWTGEDLQSNISLKAKLKENELDLPDFKPKKYGEALDHYIKEVKNSIGSMKGWKVNSNIALGFFSFTKFVMYNDLNPESWADNVDLTKNELIEAIFNPTKNKQTPFKEENIDSELKYKNMYQVLDADSSQIAAIEDVKAGRNLVVEGPPGTGKSQTIVNLIAELLAEGKSVLFVSEKMAALDVVKDRLSAVGLGKFVLELHSHKTRRKKLLKELEKATSIRAENPLKIDQTIRKLENLRKQLDDYAEVIHKPLFNVNLSAFQLYGMKESADDHFSKQNTIIPLVKFQAPEKLTLKDLDDIILSLENLSELYQTISKENPWSKCSPKSLLPSDLREIEILINDTLDSLDKFIVERDKVYNVYGIKKPDSLKDYEKSLNALKLIEEKNSSLIDSYILMSNLWKNHSNDVNLLIAKLEDYQNTSKILNKFNDSILTCDIDSLILEVKKLTNKRFRFFKSKQDNQLVEGYYKVEIPSTENILNDLIKVRENINYRKELLANNEIANKYFGEYWHLDAKISDLKSISKWMREFNQLLDEGIFSVDTIDLLSKDLFNINPNKDLADYIDSGKDFTNKLSKLESKLNPRSKLIFKKDTKDVSFEKWANQLNNWRGQLSSLHLWSQYLNTKKSCKGTDSESFIETIEKRNIKKEDIHHLVLGNFADSLLNIIFIENQVLASFIGELHENRINEFKDLDKKILELNRKRIFHKLNKNIPKIFGATDNPEAKVLAGEFTRKSGHLPVRKLLEKAGGLVKQIKPCFMMSPLSIAQYLDPTNEKLQFDVVIFDEASQVKPEDALGAFMRGKTAVVMGDTQQLPPTSFFDQLASGESGEEVATSLDMESILHLCKLSFPVKMLKWHYRSRHESLISVSNKEFYDDELLVYPSPSHNDPELGLKFHYNPNTYYDRGHTSANREEAKDVVKEIFNHFDKFGDSKSLGVGTFSVSQMNAILEELEVERKKRPELEPLFSENKDERFFVKNLETIQGDERDVILISVGYGFDADGKMSLNFGPLNQDGGERRLNVLITRAREKCVVFSNFKAYDMHLQNNPPFGAKALKEFLAYAENLTLGAINTEETMDEPFEEAIRSFLMENGYIVDKQIGCAGFRVDLAIAHEENPGKYILGITTDGKMYSSSKVARDRDRLREQVLTGLGWRLYHLWSTDWYRNRDLTRKKLLNAVEKAKIETIEEEKMKSEEVKKLSEKRKAEAEKKARELRIAKEKELAEIAAQKEEDLNINPKEDIHTVNFKKDANENKIKINPLLNNKVNRVSIKDKLFKKSEDKDLSDDMKEEDNILKKPRKRSSDKKDGVDVSNVKFKSNINIDSDDINEIATNIVNESFDNILDEAIVKNDSANKNNLNNNINNQGNNQNNESTIKTSDNLDSKSILSDINEDISSGIEYTEIYEGVSDINNPLKKNNIFHKSKDKKDKKSVRETINDFKNEVKYINKSLKEIENPTPPEYVQIIDRTEEYHPEEIFDEYAPDREEDKYNALSEEYISENEPSIQNIEEFVPEEEAIILSEDQVVEEYDFIEENESLSFAEAEEERIRKETLMDALKKEIASDENVIIPIHQEERRKNIEDKELENIIQDVDEDYKEIEKERFQKNNKLKAFDNKKLPKKGESIKDNLVTYGKATDIGISSSKELYNLDSIGISNVIYNIVKIEGPIHIDEVINRVKENCNIKRAGVKLKKTLKMGIEKSEEEGQILRINDFLYDSSNNKVVIRKREKPNIDLISIEEIQKNIEIVLLIKQEVKSKSLTRMVARNFGFKSTSKKTASKINTVLDGMIAQGIVNMVNDIVELKS